MRLSLIVAMAENRVIGREGALPWHLPADLRHFQQVTIGHPVVMGRKTFESVGRPLRGRTNVVITRNPEYRAEGVVIAHSLDDALSRLSGEDEVFVLGGEAVFREAAPKAQRLHLTLVHAAIEGDTESPEECLEGWQLVSERYCPPDADNVYAMTFRLYQRQDTGS